MLPIEIILFGASINYFSILIRYFISIFHPVFNLLFIYEKVLENTAQTTWRIHEIDKILLLLPGVIEGDHARLHRDSPLLFIFPAVHIPQFSSQPTQNCSYKQCDMPNSSSWAFHVRLSNVHHKCRLDYRGT